MTLKTAALRLDLPGAPAPTEFAGKLFSPAERTPGQLQGPEASTGGSVRATERASPGVEEAVQDQLAQEAWAKGGCRNPPLPVWQAPEASPLAHFESLCLKGPSGSPGLTLLFPGQAWRGPAAPQSPHSKLPSTVWPFKGRGEEGEAGLSQGTPKFSGP